MIRQANKYDIPNLIGMLKKYRDSTSVEILRQANNEEYITQILSEIILGAGFIFIAEKNNVAIGMLIAIKIPNIWNPTAIQCSEVAYWVDPDYRGGFAAYRLIFNYVHECEKLMEEGMIQAYTISKMVDSPDLQYARFGFQKLEETWIR